MCIRVHRFGKKAVDKLGYVGHASKSYQNIQMGIHNSMEYQASQIDTGQERHCIRYGKARVL